MTQTEALKLALEALEMMESRFGSEIFRHEIQPSTFGCHHNSETCPLCNGLVTGWRAVRAANQAITAIKEALAQPEQLEGLQLIHKADIDLAKKRAIEAQPEHHELQAEGKHPAPCARFCEANAFQIEIRRLKAQLVQPKEPAVQQRHKQEPVAWRHSLTGCLFETEEEVPLADGDEWAEPLYTTPPQRHWVSLTDEEVAEIERNSLHRGQAIRAIEAKLREKNDVSERKPLTDKQIVQLSLEWPAETNDWASHIDFARAIEAAHGIKE